MAEAGININYVVRHLIFIQQLLTEQLIVSGKMGWLDTTRDRTGRKKTNSTCFKACHSHHTKAEEISSTKAALLNVKELSLVRKDPLKPEPYPMHMEDGMESG